MKAGDLLLHAVFFDDEVLLLHVEDEPSGIIRDVHDHLLHVLLRGLSGSLLKNCHKTEEERLSISWPHFYQVEF